MSGKMKLARQEVSGGVLDALAERHGIRPLHDRPSSLGNPGCKKEVLILQPSRDNAMSPKADGPGSFKHGAAAYKAGDFATALACWRPLAEAGDTNAQNNLGGMYFRGEGVARDDAEAMTWFRRAAEQGHADAMFNLAGLHYVGGYVVRDYGAALEWYRRAADRGHAGAQFNLGAAYINGEHVARDYAEAWKWLQLAADQGHERAARALEEMLRSLPPAEIDRLFHLFVD